MGNEFVILIVEAMVMYFLVLWAHSLRHRFGPVHFYALIGGITAVMSWVTDAGVAVQIGQITFVVGSTVFYTSLILGVFVVYVFDGPRATRVVISTVIGVSVMVPIIAAAIHFQTDLVGNARIPYVPLPSLRINAASVIATLFDLVFLAMVWEFLGKPKFHLRLWVQAFLTLIGVMWLDVLLFATGAFAGTPDYLHIMEGTFVSRLVISVFAFPFLCGYLYWQNKKSGYVIENRPVLAILNQVAEIEHELSLLQQEIQQRKKVESSLRESEQRYRSIFENKQIVMLVVDPETGEIMDANPAATEYYGWAYEDFMGMCIADINIQPREKVCQTMQDAISGKQNFFHFQHRLKDGTVRDVDVDSGPIAYDGKTFLFSIVYDVTERKRAQSQIANQKKLFETMFNTIPDGVVMTNTRREIELANQGMKFTFGYEPEELLGKSTEMFYADQNRYRDAGAAVYGKNAKKSGDLYVTRYRHKSGREFPGETFGAKLFDENNQWIGNFGVMRDITERELAEKRIQQAQKMESIGTLAGGIAHDFNNILSAILGYTELSLDDVENDSTIKENLQEIYNAGKRARDLVKQILAFARQSDEEIKPMQVDTIVKEVSKFIRSSIPVTIQINEHIESDSLILGNATQIHQVFMNLFTNAAHAMEEAGGILDVSVKDIVIDDSENWKAFGLETGPCIEIKVADTGVGIDPKIIDTIFDPFFTTKGPGEGTGMGLAVVHGIIESHGGTIKADSIVGNGSTFTVYLPVSKKRNLQRIYESEALPSGTEHILFVDDEVQLVQMGGQILERLGYSVTARTSSVEALELFHTKPDAFDLVITDMTMPNLTGDQLAIEMMNIRPDIPVILCTGYSKRISDKIAINTGIKAFTYKPIVKADLAKTIRKVLDEAMSSAK